MQWVVSEGATVCRRERQLLDFDFQSLAIDRLGAAFEIRAVRGAANGCLDRLCYGMRLALVTARGLGQDHCMGGARGGGPVHLHPALRRRFVELRVRWLSLGPRIGEELLEQRAGPERSLDGSSHRARQPILSLLGKERVPNRVLARAR